jgi:hypothetical protein
MVDAPDFLDFWRVLYLRTVLPSLYLRLFQIWSTVA